MAKRSEKQAQLETATAVGAAAAVLEPEPETETAKPPVNREEVTRLAYTYWQARGCPEGSPEEDWFRAEAELEGQARGKAV